MTNHSTSSAPAHARALAPQMLGLTGGDAVRIAAAIDAELAASTRRAYASAWRQWEIWCEGRGIAALPATPEAIAAFLTERAETGLCYGTLDGAWSAIAHRHHQDGLPDPTADVVVRRVRRGLRRIMGAAIGVRDRAVILLGYASALRPGELSALDLGDIIAKPPDKPTRSERSTTGSRSDPRFRVRSSPGSADLAPLRPSASGPRAVSRLVHARAIEAGFDGIQVTGHSLRAGHATTAALNGAPIEQTSGRSLDDAFAAK